MYARAWIGGRGRGDEKKEKRWEKRKFHETFETKCRRYAQIEFIFKMYKTCLKKN